MVLVWDSSTQAGQTPQVTARLLVPAYGNPCCGGGLTMWPQLTETASALGPDLLVILNPNSGPGASPIDPNYVNESGQGPFIEYRQAGGLAIGYVRTDWADQPLAVVQDEIDRYFDPTYWSGAGVQIDGIFFDEMSNDLGDVGYYETLRDYVRGQLANAIVIGNPGTSFVNNRSGQSMWSVTDYAETADVLVTFELNAGEYVGNYTPPSWAQDFPSERFGNIVYGVENETQMRQLMSLAKTRKAGYVYFTDDVLPNPYDALATYWQAEVEAAQSLIFANGFESGNAEAWLP